MTVKEQREEWARLGIKGSGNLDEEAVKRLTSGFQVSFIPKLQNNLGKTSKKNETTKSVQEEET